jgi:hypothetical protein
MKCDQARTAYLAGEASHDEMDHLEACAACRSERTALEDSRAVLDDEATWTDPSPQLEDRIVALIAGTPGAREATPSSRRRWWWAGGAGIAAAIVAFVAIVLTSAPGPDWEIPIPGTAEAPVAAGVVRGWNEADGTRIQLDVAGLPPAPTGSVYELWFSKDELHISAGTFVSAGNPELWVGVSRGDFPRLWITLEPLDTDESPSGVTVMDTHPRAP